MVKKESMPRMTTSLKIDRDIWKKAKIAAIEKDLELSQLIESAINQFIDQKKKSS